MGTEKLPPTFKLWLDNHRNKYWEIDVEEFRQKFYCWMVKQDFEWLQFRGHHERDATEFIVKQFIRDSKQNMGLQSAEDFGQISDIIESVISIRNEYTKSGEQQ